MFVRIKRKVFERHSNPLSAWSRLLSSPLIYVPIWNRSWKQGSIVAVWMLLNPVVFPKPKDDSAWATKAMLGEEMWIEDRPMDKAMLVNVLASMAGVAGIISARKKRAAFTASSSLAQTILLLMYWNYMVDFYESKHRR